MDKEELDNLEALARAATPGPWTVAIDGTCSGAWPHINTVAVDEDGEPIFIRAIQDARTSQPAIAARKESA